MRYRILGPLSVTEDGQEVAITAGRDRILLATLLLNAPRVVDHATLAEALWGIGPPSTARSQLHICVSRLRRRLPPKTIVSDPARYRLICDPGDLDATTFTRLVARARDGHDAALYREALDPWRGEALVGLDSQPIRSGAAVLDERYVAALEEWAELELAAGRDRELVGPLSEAVERFADRYLAAALRLARRRGNRPVEAEVLNEKAIVLRRRVRHDEATALHQAAIAMIRPTSFPSSTRPNAGWRR